VSKLNLIHTAASVLPDPGRVADHVRRHVLEDREARGWRLLLPLLDELAGDDPRSLSDLRRDSHSRGGPGPDLEALIRDYRLALAEAVGQAVQRCWHWRERAADGDLSWTGFSPSGILTVFDAEFVRTGYLPGKLEYRRLARSIESNYLLFQTCWRATRAKFDQASRHGLVCEVTPQMRGLLSRMPTPTAWRALASETRESMDR
jgi:hypothetical protein